MSWTPERRKRQAALIHRWQPWKQSTGARTDAGKAISSKNAFKGGVRQEQRAIAKELRELARYMKAGW